MDRFQRPDSLAEAVTHGHGRCPLPATHDRLDECHYWWHQMAKQYHEPAYFRWSFGAFIQGARNVTWMLQSEKDAFSDFSWYSAWQTAARQVPTLKWLNETRVTLTKRAALEPTSWARFRCLKEQVDPEYAPDDDDLYFHLNPFLCTHEYIRGGPIEDHGHEYQRSWEVAELPGRELLEVGAEVYDLLAEVVGVAHEHLGHAFTTAKDVERERPLVIDPTGRHRMPCMVDTANYRTISTYIRDGAEHWDDGPEHV